MPNYEQTQNILFSNVSREKVSVTSLIKTCANCILDVNDDPYITFDNEGVCNHCHLYWQQKALYVKEGREGEKMLEEKVAEIKRAGKGQRYDCLIGLSGGVDSSYVAFIAKQKGLRPLCVHFDNGWNSEFAVHNIKSIVHKLEFDLHTYVINWEEFKDLQLAYLRASVIDIEVITDHAIYGTLYKVAKQNNIKYILGGHNVVTETILPAHWGWAIKDYINIKAIHKKYGHKKLKSYPFLTRRARKRVADLAIETVYYLNWISYNKKEAKKVLQNELGWVDYGSKHHESVWTRFFQVYILPKKFGVDKRKAHLSNLICSGQMTKEEALNEIALPPYDQKLLTHDMDFVLKKLGLTEPEFNKIMNAPVHSHKDFDYEGSLFYYYPIIKPLRPLWEVFKKLFRGRALIVMVSMAADYRAQLLTAESSLW